MATDAFPALRALTEALLTRADPDYLRRQVYAAVKVMADHGCAPPTPWPDASFGVAVWGSERPVDSVRLDWLDAACNEMLLEFGFEIDGGVYLRIDAPGFGGADIREKNSARDLIDSGRVTAPYGEERATTCPKCGPSEFDREEGTAVCLGCGWTTREG